MPGSRCRPAHGRVPEAAQPRVRAEQTQAKCRHREQHSPASPFLLPTRPPLLPPAPRPAPRFFRKAAGDPILTWLSLTHQFPGTETFSGYEHRCHARSRTSSGPPPTRSARALPDPQGALRTRRRQLLTDLLFVRVDQLLVLPVSELPGCFRRGQGGVEDEQLPGTVCGLRTVAGNIVGGKVYRKGTRKSNENISTFCEPSTENILSTLHTASAPVGRLWPLRGTGHGGLGRA